VAPYLQDQGYNVSCTDVVPFPADCENAKRKLPFFKADLLNMGDCLQAVLWSECDAIVHLGAIPNNTELQPAYDQTPKAGVSTAGARNTWRMPEDSTMKINTMGLYYILDAARRLKVKNFISATSYFSYGMGFRISGEPWIPHYLPVDEEHPCEPEDTYSLSKYLNEETMKPFHARTA
jgi:nucleoside-diphosphate-sugar epimerase